MDGLLATGLFSCLRKSIKRLLALSLSIETVNSFALPNTVKYFGFLFITRHGSWYVDCREECAASFRMSKCRLLLKLGSTKLRRVDGKRLSRYLNCKRKLLWESRDEDDASLDDMLPNSKNSPGKRRFVPKTISLDVVSKSTLVEIARQALLAASTISCTNWCH